MIENINQINNNKHEVINATKISHALNVEYDSHEMKTIEPKNYKNKILSQNVSIVIEIPLIREVIQTQNLNTYMKTTLWGEKRLLGQQFRE